jgi:hypothetical protein
VQNGGEARVLQERMREMDRINKTLLEKYRLLE